MTDKKITTGPITVETGKIQAGTIIVQDGIETVFECQSCDWRGPESKLALIKDLTMRVSAGEPMPAGECPECGALCHEAEPFECVRTGNHRDTGRGVCAHCGAVLGIALQTGPFEDALKIVAERDRLKAALVKAHAALQTAESFMSGFEDDETQDGMDDMLAEIRGAISIIDETVKS